VHVAVDESFRRAAEAGRADVAIDPRFLRPHGKPLHCPAHGEHRGVEDVEPVDLLYGGKRHRPGDRALLDALGEHLAPLGSQQLGIGEAVDAPSGIQDHRAGIHGAGERAAPGLVDAAHEQVSAGR
jgi:hypothetical protein